MEMIVLSWFGDDYRYWTFFFSSVWVWAVNNGFINRLKDGQLVRLYFLLTLSSNGPLRERRGPWFVVVELIPLISWILWRTEVDILTVLLVERIVTAEWSWIGKSLGKCLDLLMLMLRVSGLFIQCLRCSWEVSSGVNTDYLFDGSLCSTVEDCLTGFLAEEWGLILLGSGLDVVWDVVMMVSIIPPSLLLPPLGFLLTNLVTSSWCGENYSASLIGLRRATPLPTILPADICPLACAPKSFEEGVSYNWWYTQWALRDVWLSLSGYEFMCRDWAGDLLLLLREEAVFKWRLSFERGASNKIDETHNECGAGLGFTSFSRLFGNLCGIWIAAWMWNDVSRCTRWCWWWWGKIWWRWWASLPPHSLGRINANEISILTSFKSASAILMSFFVCR